ncbi:hypothetical protein [Thermoclostridium stercorarium]|uniref:hypothetical protein n=1 Tax=Thermoclostridium stercorarium TaxID=1510 RepID=UPI00209208B2|nr:hypothetical protein [Thermoclostridium stercorarium]
MSERQEARDVVMLTVKVKITGTNGEPVPEYLLNTLYASDLHFEPDIRRSRIMPDGPWRST